MAFNYKKYTLTGAAVDEISADVQQYLKELRTDSVNIQRIRLTVEELLLNILGGAEKPVQVSVGLGKQFGRRQFRLRYEGPAFDPTKNSDSPWFDDIMRSLGFSPSWSYRGKANTVSLVLADRPKRSTVFWVMLAVAAAALLGLAGSLFQDSLRLGLCESVLTPLAESFLGLLRTFSGLMIALTICNGILGMGDSASFGRTGKTVLLRFVGISFAISIASAAMLLPFLNLDFSQNAATGQSTQLSRISGMIFDILPSNIVEPFQTGNALQIIVIAIITGIGLINIGERGSRIRSLAEDAAVLLQHIVSMICALVPVFVFVMVLRLIWMGQIKQMISVIKPLLMCVSLTLVLAVALWMITALRLKCAPMRLIKKILPPFLIALSTASSMSALPLAMEICEKKLGIRKSTVSFIFPLGSVIYMPATIVFFTVLSCAFAITFQVGISLAWLIMEVVIVTLIVIALPPIPGASLLGFTILFSSLGIPSDALVLAAAMDIVIDFFDTGFNVMLLMLHSGYEAKRLDELDPKILSSQLR